MQYKVCKCFSIQGQDYEPEGGTNADALNLFEGSGNHAATLLAGGYICKDESTGGYVAGPDKDIGGTDKKCVESINGQLPDDSGAVAFKQSTTADVNGGKLVTTSDDNTAFICDKQSKGLRDNGDGTKTEIFVGQDGVQSEGEILTSSSTATVTGGVEITTADNETTFVCSLQGKSVVLNPLTNMNEMVDQNGDPMGVSWFSVEPENRVKNQIVTVDGEVTDDNGNSVPATGLGGAAIVQGGLVAVECDPDGNVVNVAVFPVDTTVGVEYLDGSQPDFNSMTNNFVLKDCVDIQDKGDDTYTITPSNGDDPYDIDTRCKKYICLDIEPCPIAFPLCGVSAAGDTEFTDAASIQTFLDANYGDELVFNEADCTIKGCMLADVDFDLEFREIIGTVSFAVSAGALQLRVVTSDGSAVEIKWPDGTTITSNSTVNNLHTSAIAGDVEITISGCACVTEFDIIGPWNFDVADLNQLGCLERFASGVNNTTFGDICDLPDTLLYYNNKGVNVTAGDIDCLPDTLEHFTNLGQNTTLGNICDLPSGLTHYANGGQNTTSGLIDCLPSSLTYYLNEGQNTTTGDLANLPVDMTYYCNKGQNTTYGLIDNLPAGLTYYCNLGSNTTGGDLANLPVGLQYYINLGNNITTGDIGTLPSGLVYYQNVGSNTTSGSLDNLPAGVTYYQNHGQNTTDGDIANLPAGVTYYDNQGNNTTTGDIGSLPVALRYYINTGANTSYGDIGGLPSTLVSYTNQGANTAIASAGATLPSSMISFTAQPTPGYTQAEVDAILQALLTVGTWTGSGNISLGLNNAPPSAAGDGYVTTLTANGANVSTN